MKRVVLVDDEDDIRELAALSLESLRGWDVVTVASGVDAPDVVAREQPDAVLLDVTMPGQDGPSTLAELRRRAETRDVPVVFLTAKTQARDRAQLEALGAAGVLAKPFDPMTLGDQLAAVLGWA